MRGGRRTGSGRTPLWNTPECHWIVREARRISGPMLETRQREVGDALHPEYEEVREGWAKLKKKTPPGSVPDAEILEDIAFHFPAIEPDDKTEHLNLPRVLPAATLSPLAWGRVYAEVAASASSHFQKTISVRQVKRCIAEWLKFESTL